MKPGSPRQKKQSLKKGRGRSWATITPSSIQHRNENVSSNKYVLYLSQRPGKGQSRTLENSQTTASPSSQPQKSNGASSTWANKGGGSQHVPLSRACTQAPSTNPGLLSQLSPSSTSRVKDHVESLNSHLSPLR